MNHGQRILEGLRALMKSLGRKPSDVESGAWIDTYLKDNAVKLKRAKPAGLPKARARDAVFDLLAALSGVADTKQLTRHGASKIAEAKKQILEVLPEKPTAVVLVEINERWALWCRKCRDAKMQTVMALVAHWAELGGGPRTKSEALNVYVEPVGDWRQVMAVVCKIDPSALVDKAWSELGVEYRAAVLKDMARNKA